MKLVLPYPPSTNHNAYWGQVGHRRYLTVKAKHFRGLVAVECQRGPVRNYFDKPVRMTVELFPPDRRARDIDNPIKALLDALQHAGAIENDVLVQSLHIEKRDVVKGGQCVVEIVAILSAEER